MAPRVFGHRKKDPKRATVQPAKILYRIYQAVHHSNILKKAESDPKHPLFMNKVKELRIEENKNANIMNEKYQSEEMSMLHKVTEYSSKCVEIVTEGSKIVVDSIKQLKKDSEGFVEEAKVIDSMKIRWLPFTTTLYLW